MADVEGPSEARPTAAAASAAEPAPSAGIHAITRRQFLSGGVAASVAGAAGLVVARHPWAAAHARRASIDGRGTLVMVTLYGGNDGLNTVIPFEDGHYLGGRAQLGYQPNEVLAIGDGLGLHPSLKGMKQLWGRGQLAIVRGVGYPNPSRSHFRSMDIWQSGVPDHDVPSGWLGRWLDTGTDPLRALSIGPNLPRLLAGERASGAAVPLGAFRLPGGPSLSASFADLQRPFPGEPALEARVAQSGADLLRVQSALAEALSHQPAPAPAGGAGPAAAPAGNPLAAQLDLVARSIKSGLATRAYAVSLGGFDTHANEKQVHSELLGQLDAALTGFASALAGDRRGQDVVTVVYSEFGRRVAANASGGTDHGTAAPVLVAGPRVRGGFYGAEPNLADLDQGDIRFTTDFRSVYATVLEGVLGVDSKVGLGARFAPLGFL